ncbi:AMP-binding protein [Streptomyces lydicus]|uniref:AMP-binding protein n=1 Tax=Streptomyces lydicus TaxID=47763 RepID=UPI003698AB61
MSPPLPPSPASHVPAGDLAGAAGEPSIGPELPPTDWSVHEQVAAVARARPHHTAVSGGGIRLSYRQPDAWARRIADRLTAAGAGHGSRVGVLRAPSPAMVTAVLGVLRTGAAYVPLDPAHPDRRLADLLADAGGKTVVVTGEAGDRLAGSGLGVVTARQAAARRARALRAERRRPAPLLPARRRFRGLRHPTRAPDRVGSP